LKGKSENAVCKNESLREERCFKLRNKKTEIQREKAWEEEEAAKGRRGELWCWNK
jgi:hypothetical protein